MIFKVKIKKVYLTLKKKILLFWLSLEFKILPDQKFLTLQPNATKQESKLEWSPVIILLLLEPSLKMSELLEVKKINQLCKELILLNLLEVLYAKNVELQHAIVLELLNKLNNNKNNSEQILSLMVNNLIKSKINFQSQPDLDLKINMLWLLV